MSLIWKAISSQLITPVLWRKHLISRNTFTISWYYSLWYHGLSFFYIPRHQCIFLSLTLPESYLSKILTHFEWTLHRVRDRTLVSLFYTCITSFLSTTSWRETCFSNICFWYFSIFNRRGTHKKFQKYGHLNQIYTITPPVYIPMWMKEISQDQLMAVEWGSISLLKRWASWHVIQS